MSDTMETLLIAVRADTQGFARDVAQMRGELEGPLAAGMDKAGRALEVSLNRFIQTGKFGFEDLKLHRIEAGCAVDNIGSFTVLKKVGMLREAHTRQLLPLKSGWSDNYGYAILSTDERK